MNRQTIRVAAAVVVSGLGVTLAQDAATPEVVPPDRPLFAQAEPAAAEAPTPKVIHTPEGVKIQKEGVEVSRFDTVSLNVQDADLADVLQLLSVQAQRNIVPSPKVSGRVTANLYDVTFYEALDAILAQNGAGYIEKGEFIYVYTNDELKKIREAERKMVHRVFRLDYMTAADASTFATAMLSDNGKISLVAAVDPGFQPSLEEGGENSHAGSEVMLVRDYPENVEEVAKLIAELDIAPEQVLIEATVLQARLNEDMAFGVDLNILANLGFEEFTGDLLGSIIDDPPVGAVGTTVGNAVDGKGGLKVGVVTHNVSVFLRALDEVTDTTVLANPKVMTLNRQRAEVLVGQKIAYLSTTATATATTQTVNFLETGTQLTVRPFISREGVVRLELKPSISSVDLREAGSGVGGVVTLPDETTQELTTNVMVRDGQTVVLGGLFQEQTTITRRQVPLLGDIPVAGWAFKGKDDAVVRSEVIFLITPRIMRDNALKVAGDSAMEDIEKLRVGTKEHLLPWSRTRQTAGHLRDAMGHMERGERDKAMWEIDEALRLDPQMVEARRLKEKLTGQRTYWPTDGILQESIDMVIDEQAGHRTREQVDVVPDPLPALPARPEDFDPHAVDVDVVPTPVAPVEDPAPAVEPVDPSPAAAPEEDSAVEVETFEDAK